MRIDNSAFTIYQECALKYNERYVRQLPVDGAGPGIEPIGEKPDRDFGTRFHQLLHNYHLKLMGRPELVFPGSNDDVVEADVARTWAAYQAHYPVEPLRFISAERTDVVPLPGSRHQLAVKLDGVVRHLDGTIGFYDAKTERPRSTYNEPEAWAARSQATLYLWALGILYPAERVSRGVVDVITRGGPKSSPLFRRMDDITRTPARMQETVRNVIRVADEIERHTAEGWWPRTESHCKDGWKRCDFYALHVFPGESLRVLEQYKAAERYLDV